MTLKKAMVLTAGSLGWLAYSYGAFVKIGDADPTNRREFVDDTLLKRLIWVASGPLFWVVAGVVVATDDELRNKLTGEFKGRLENFLRNS